MTDDIRELLRAADGGAVEPDHGYIRERGKRLEARRTRAVFAGIAVVLLGVVGVVLTAITGDGDPVQFIDDPPPDEGVTGDPAPAPDEEETRDPAPAPDRVGVENSGPDPDTPSDDPGPEPDAGPPPEPSQTPEEAERDGVLPEVAAIPFEVRVGVAHEAQPTDTTRISTDEGVWLVSRTGRPAAEHTGNHLVGDRDGLYGRDYLSLHDYGEILLLDAAETRIERAFPMTGLKPSTIAITDDAVYCARQGDGGNPDSALCRIDRESLDWQVRVFPSSSDTAFTGTDTFVPANWTLDDVVTEPLFSQLVVRDGELYLVADPHLTRVDPDNLELDEPSALADAGWEAADRPLIASMWWLAELDPQTGAVLRTIDAPTGEGSVSMSLTPDGRTVFHDELDTGCRTNLWRTPLDGGESELLGRGMGPAVSPDGTTLAYAGYDECMSDAHHLVLRDLADGSEHRIDLGHHADDLARIATLSWHPGSELLAVEVTFTTVEENHIGGPTSSAILLVDTTDGSAVVEDGRLVAPEDPSVQWHLPTFSGDQTLLVVEMCCDVGSARRDAGDRYTILEVDLGQGGDPRPAGALHQTTTQISHLATDRTGEQILFVERELGLRPSRSVLRTLVDGQPRTISEANVMYADW